jgi:hypothetical protein
MSTRFKDMDLFIDANTITCWLVPYEPDVVAGLATTIHKPSSYQAETKSHSNQLGALGSRGNFSLAQGQRWVLDIMSEIYHPVRDSEQGEYTRGGQPVMDFIINFIINFFQFIVNHAIPSYAAEGLRARCHDCH